VLLLICRDAPLQRFTHMGNIMQTGCGCASILDGQVGADGQMGRRGEYNNLRERTELTDWTDGRVGVLMCENPES